MAPDLPAHRGEVPPVHLDRQRGQSWTTFIRNHLHQTWACDFFVLITARFRVLYVFVVLSLGRRTIVHAGVTEHPTARWAAQRIAEATSDAQQIPRFLVHDRDSIYGADFQRRVRGLGTRLLATPLRSPTANPFGGTPREIFSKGTAFTRLVIVGDPLCGVTSNLKAISFEPLGVDGRAGTTIFSRESAQHHPRAGQRGRFPACFFEVNLWSRWKRDSSPWALTVLTVRA